MASLLSLSVATFAGLMMTRAVKNLRLPDVTAYLVAGVLIGPCFIGALNIPGLGFYSYDQLEGLGLISDVALGFIAFSIGNEFRLSQLKETGRQAFIVGVLQAVAATLLVDAALLLFHADTRLLTLVTFVGFLILEIGTLVLMAVRTRRRIM